MADTVTTPSAPDAPTSGPLDAQLVALRAQRETAAADQAHASALLKDLDEQIKGAVERAKVFDDAFGEYSRVDTGWESLVKAIGADKLAVGTIEASTLPDKLKKELPTAFDAAWNALKLKRDAVKADKDKADAAAKDAASAAAALVAANAAVDQLKLESKDWDARAKELAALKAEARAFNDKAQLADLFVTLKLIDLKLADKMPSPKEYAEKLQNALNAVRDAGKAADLAKAQADASNKAYLADKQALDAAEKSLRADVLAALKAVPA